MLTATRVYIQIEVETKTSDPVFFAENILKIIISLNMHVSALGFYNNTLTFVSS